MPICTRPSCGEDFTSSSPCTHHPGHPIFHEGQKSWSCCNQVNKPVLDFDDFVKIKGCTTVEGHSDVKPVKPAAPKADTAAPEGVKMEGGKEVYGAVPSAASSSSAAAPVTATVPAAAAAPAPPATGSAPPQPPVEPEDPDEAVIQNGATCKRPGCGAVFSGEGSKRDKSKEECRYHKGAPIFHEGSKGYMCCKRRVLEFSEFLKIEPCTTSSSGHLYIQPPKRKAAAGGANGASGASSSSGDATSGGATGGDDLLKARGMGILEGEEEADCRMDHYETPDEIRMTVYCKGVRMEQSRVELEENDILLSLSLPPLPAQGPSAPPRRHLLHLPLYAPILPHPASSYTVSPSKIKIDFILKKGTPGVSWPTLVKGGVGGGYGLTFGRK